MRSQYLAQQCTPPFVAAWQAARTLSEAGEDRGALLRHLTASGTLPAALRSPLWQMESSVRFLHVPIGRIFLSCNKYLKQGQRTCGVKEF